MRRFATIAAVVLVCVAMPRDARAQGVGVRAGVSGEPDQFYFGVHAETAPIFDHVRFRPNVELGFGNDEELLALNFELVYKRAIKKQPWHILMGGGPAAVIVMRDTGNNDSDTNTGGGLNLLLGLEHTRGFFTELKVGLIDSPTIKFAIGYTFR